MTKGVSGGRRRDDRSYESEKGGLGFRNGTSFREGTLPLGDINLLALQCSVNRLLPAGLGGRLSCGRGCVRGSQTRRHKVVGTEGGEDVLSGSRLERTEANAEVLLYFDVHNIQLFIINYRPKRQPHRQYS